MWFVPKVSVLIFLCTNWQRSTSLMYIGTLVVTLDNLVTFAMQANIEQGYAIKFCVKLNKFATETFASLTEAYGDATQSRTMVFKWHKAFKEGRENVEDDPHSGRPISSTNDQNVEVVRAVMAKDRRLNVGMIAEETGLNKNAVHRILTEYLHMRKICQNWCRKTCLWSKKRTGWKFVRICWEDSKLSQIFCIK